MHIQLQFIEISFNLIYRMLIKWNRSQESDLNNHVNILELWVI